MKDIVFDFNSSENKDKDSVWFDVKITPTENQRTPCDINGWVATGTNYTQADKMESGKCVEGGLCEPIKFYENYIVNGVSKWKVWAKDDTSKFFYITLYGRKNNGDEIDEDSNILDSSEFVCSALTENLTFPCCYTTMQVDMALAKKVVDLDNVATDSTNATTLIPLVTASENNVIITTTNFNDFGYVSGYCTNNDEGLVTLKFSAHTNCYRDAKAVTNIAYITDLDNEDDTYSFEVIQTPPIAKRSFNKQFSSQIINYNLTEYTFGNLSLGTQYFCTEGSNAIDALTNNDGIEANINNGNIEINNMQGVFTYANNSSDSVTLSTNGVNNTTLAQYSAVELYDKISQSTLMLYLTRHANGYNNNNGKRSLTINLSGSDIGGEFLVRVGSRGPIGETVYLGSYLNENLVQVYQGSSKTLDAIYGDRYEIQIKKLYKVNGTDFINVGYDLTFKVNTSGTIENNSIEIDKPSSFNGIVGGNNITYTISL